MDDLVYTIKEAAQVMKTSPNFIRELIKKGELPYLKLGSIKIRRVAIEQLLERMEIKAWKKERSYQWSSDT